MSTQVDQTAQIKFLNNAELMLGQHKSRIFSLIKSYDVGGAEMARIKDYFGRVRTRTGDDRHGDTQYNNTPHDGLWLPRRPEEYTADLVDRADQQVTSLEIGSGYMMSQTAAINLIWDDIALAALYSPLISGKAGALVSTPLGSSMTVPVTEGGASGVQPMNDEKLDAAQQLLAEAYNDPNERKFVVMREKDNRNLRRSLRVTSSEFAAMGGYVNPTTGMVERWNGWTIIPFELADPYLKFTSQLYLDGSGYVQLPYWKESGLASGTWEKLFSGIDRLPQKRYSTQYFLGTTVNVTRTQAGKSGLILVAA